jgi:beta-aspartyl-dipeptidase (metallo-type)
VDITAFPVADDEDAWAADVAFTRYLASGAPAHRITMSSDGGGCLPVFDAEGAMLSMDVGRASALLTTLVALQQKGMPLETALPAFTSNVADLLRLPGRGYIQVGYQADLLILDETQCLSGVMIAGRWHRRDGQQVIKGYFEP